MVQIYSGGWYRHTRVCGTDRGGWYRYSQVCGRDTDVWYKHSCADTHRAQTLSGVCGLSQWTHVEEWVGTWLRPWKARAADGLKVWGFRPKPQAPAQAGVQQDEGSFPPRPHLIGLAASRPHGGSAVPPAGMPDPGASSGSRGVTSRDSQRGTYRSDRETRGSGVK